MRKSNRRRPEVESLESMMLLSTLVVEADHAKPVVALAAGPVALTGVVRGTAQLSGSRVTVNGTGNLGPVGVATIRTTVNLNNPPSTFTLTTRRGKLFLATNSPLQVTGTSGTAQYTITGGTGTYVGATGSGNLLARLTQIRGNRGVATLRFS